MKKFILLLSFISINSCSGGTLRERIKERIEERINNKPAPILSEINGKLNNSGEYNFKLVSSNKDRVYKVYLPKNFNESNAHLPLIFAFHGGGGDMEVMGNDEYYGLKSMADRENYIVVFPSGYTKFKSGKIATWNAGNCCGDARDEKIDDIKFIQDLLIELKKKFNYDESRVYAIGMSNGGMFSYKVACELSDKFKAIASVAGTDNTISCSPKSRVSILHIHALDDDHVLFNGGIGQSFSDERKSKITEFTSVNNTIEKWSKLNQCNNHLITEKFNEVVCETFDSCKDASQVRLCKVPDGGHSWPGGKTPRKFKKTSNRISANEEIIKFFNQLK